MADDIRLSLGKKGSRGLRLKLGGGRAGRPRTGWKASRASLDSMDLPRSREVLREKQGKEKGTGRSLASPRLLHVTNQRKESAAAEQQAKQAQHPISPSQPTACARRRGRRWADVETPPKYRVAHCPI